MVSGVKYMNYKEIFEQAYELMDIDLMDGDCGELCGYHCCRENHEDGSRMGIYFLPFEYETMHEDADLIDKKTLQIHTNKSYDLPKGIKRLFYGHCKDSKNCLRRIRPIQCRTFPFVPHLENDILYIVIEKDQEHSCPLIGRQDLWNPQFCSRIFKGWELLIQVPQIKLLVEFDSNTRIEDENILIKLQPL